MKKTIFILFISLFIFGTIFAIGGDNFASAVAITNFPYTDTGNTSTLTNTMGNDSPDAFYLIHSPVAITDLDISLLESDFDTYLRLYAADRTTEIAANDDIEIETDTGSYFLIQSELTNLSLAANTDYYIIVEGYDGAWDPDSGPYQIDVSTNVILATTPADGVIYQALDAQVGWNFVLNIETYDLYFDTVSPPVAMPVNNAVVSETYDPGLLNEDTIYYWKVVARNATISFESPIYSFRTGITGNCFGTAIPITNFPYTDTGNTSNFTNTMGNEAPDVFYLINSPVAITDLDISLLESDFDTFLRLYAADQTTQLAENDDIAVVSDTGTYFLLQSELTDLSLAANTDYYIIVEGFDGTWDPNSGPYQIDVDAVFALEANVIITEVNTDIVQYVELYNDGTGAQDLANWTLNQNAPSLSTPLSGTLNSGEYLVIIGGTYANMMAWHPTFAGAYIEAPTTLAMINGSWLDLNDGFAKGVVDQFGSATSGAVLGAIYERTNESSGDDLDTDWIIVPSPTPGGQNENQVLPVTLTNFAAAAMTNQGDQMVVALEWTVETESAIAGYNVYRSETDDLNTYPINSGLIVASNIATTHTYNYEDNEVEVGGTFNYWLESMSIDGISNFYGPVSVIVEEEDDTPDTPEIQIVTAIRNIFPNPFNPFTSVAFSLKEESVVKVNIYNVKGELVSELTNETYPSGTNHTVVWDGIDRNGKLSGSGIYFFKMETKGYTAVKKAVLIK